MLEGFKVDVKSEELKIRFLAKVEECRTKEKELSAKSEKVKEDIADLAKAYRTAADYYAFMAAHLIEGETYRLGKEDLNILFTEGLGIGHIGALLGRY